MTKIARLTVLPITLLFAIAQPLMAQQQATNPVIFADVPDQSIIRVGDTYYMSSTTMYLSPGLPIMKSKDLVNWELLRYAYDTLANMDALNLTDGKNAYGRGTWASCLRYHNGVYYVSTFSSTTGKTYIFHTTDIEKGEWTRISFAPSYHDHSIFFDDDGKVYLLYGVGAIKMLVLKPDLSGPDPGVPEKTIIANASAPAGSNIMLQAEGTQLFKIKGKYYLFNITWPRGGMRTVVVHRADHIGGPYEGKMVLQDRGIAQGGLIDTPEGEWYTYLFRDYGAVGRIPYLAPITWEDGWPMPTGGKVPETLNLPPQKSQIPAIVANDEFTRPSGDNSLPLVWQWNHQPDNSKWSLQERKGYLRLHSTQADSLPQARNMLTQRTFGPQCSGTTSVDVSKLADGAVAGLSLLQKEFGFIGVKVENGNRYIVLETNGRDKKQQLRIPTKKTTVWFRASCDFSELKDMATFYYSEDGRNWQQLGEPLKMRYTLPHFMGYRFGLVAYSAAADGGYADFDFFRIHNE